MKKIFVILVVFAFGLVTLPKNNLTYASWGGNCGNPTTGIDKDIPGYPETTSHTITIDMSSGNSDSHHYNLTVERGLWGADIATSPDFFINQNGTSCNSDGGDCVTVKDYVVTWTITSEQALTFGDGNPLNYPKIDLTWPPGPGSDQCDVGKLKIVDENAPGRGCSVKVFQNRNGESCYQNSTQTACFAIATPITAIVSNLTNIMGDPFNGDIGLRIDQTGGGEWDSAASNAVNGSATLTFTPNASDPPAEYRIFVESRKGINVDFPGCEFGLTADSGCSEDQCEEENILELGFGPISLGPDVFSLCNQIDETIYPDQYDKCVDCAGGVNGRAGIWTAVGCIKRDPQAIVETLVKVGLGIGGGVALLTFLAAGFIYSTSQGSSEKVKNAKEMMTASIVGIIFVIFSVTILQFIGWSILKIPGFGG